MTLFVWVRVYLGFVQSGGICKSYADHTGKIICNQVINHCVSHSATLAVPRLHLVNPDRVYCIA